MQQLEMGAYEQQQAQEFFVKQSQRFANGAAEMMGYGSSFYSIDSDMVKMAVGNPWCSGKNFSERIWDNRTKLTQTLQAEIVNGIIRGDDYHTTSHILQGRFKAVSKSNIERLVFTEDTYLQNESAMNVFANDPDFEEYTFMARKKANPCDLCKALSGKTFRIEERKPGENFPPMHPWCGCTFTIPQLDIRKVLENRRKHAAEQQKSTAIPLTDLREHGIMKSKDPLRISMQFFGKNQNIEKLNDAQLKKSIRSWKAGIELHKDKIANPKKYYPDWDTFDPRYQDGNVHHWEKEISNFETDIQRARAELRKRGIADE
ncbi:MAG: minor capsid protein [Ruminococcus sp.]|nr:minor capsid protein [Ruminococcus sp.]